MFDSQESDQSDSYQADVDRSSDEELWLLQDHDLASEGTSPGIHLMDIAKPLGMRYSKYGTPGDHACYVVADADRLYNSSHAQTPASGKQLLVIERGGEHEA